MNTWVTLAGPPAWSLNSVTFEQLCHAPLSVNTWSKKYSMVPPVGGKLTFSSLSSSCERQLHLCAAGGSDNERRHGKYLPGRRRQGDRGMQHHAQGQDPSSPS
jgi:hypothetical protein